MNRIVIFVLAALLFACSHQQIVEAPPPDDGARHIIFKYPMGAPRNALCTDFNGDGLTDLAVIQKPPSLNVFFNSPSGLGTPLVLQPNTHNAYCAAGDLNNDGLTDLIPITETVVGPFFLNEKGSFRKVEFTEMTPSFGSFITTGDFDGDGKQDIVALGLRSGEIKILFNEGDLRFTPKSYYPDPPPGEWRATDQGRQGGSGDEFQMGMPTVSGQTPAVKSRQPGPTRSGKGTGLGGFREALVFDLNGDGRPDILIADLHGQRILAAMNRGNREFDIKVLYQFRVNVSSIAPIRLPSGKLLLGVASESASKVVFLESSDNESFSIFQEIPVTGLPLKILSADLDDNGEPDFLVSIMPFDLTSYTLLAVYSPGTERMRTELTRLPDIGCSYMNVCDLYSKNDIICGDIVRNHLYILNKGILVKKR